MHKNAPGITGHQNPKVLFWQKIAPSAENARQAPKLDHRGTMDLKTEKCSEHYAFLCIRMHQGSRGTKTQKAYFRTKIAEMAKNATPEPKLDHEAPRTSKLKSVPSIMVLYA